jgi:hypothetical protein
VKEIQSEQGQVDLEQEKGMGDARAGQTFFIRCWEGKGGLYLPKYCTNNALFSLGAIMLSSCAERDNYKE